jgi:YidC/Oxa1 family membrane protein insertase
MLSILYYLIIYPIELLVEVTFTVLNLILDNPGLSIVGVSLVINFLILPMYRRSDALQEKERTEQKKLSHWVKHIRKTFHGDEQFMMLQEYYRQNNYKPIYALRGSISLLLQIPFFIAAYHYLSNLDALQGTSFLFITDMGRPDGLIRIGSLSINLLPILMTSINFLSGAIYTKGFELKDKLQLYIMALLFLVLLYTSPSGLVLYWTCNNTFSLCKNIFLKKMKHPHEVFSGISAVFGTVLCVFLFLQYNKLLWHFIALLILLISLMPLLKILNERKNFIAKISNGIIFSSLFNNANDSKETTVYFQCGIVSLALITGLLIPSALIGSSPTEFVLTSDVFNPSRYLLYSMAIAAGCFALWLNIFFFLMDEGKKKWSALAMWILLGIAITDYLFFGKNYGTISIELQFNRAPDPTGRERWLNLAVLCGVMLLFLILWKYRRKVLVPLYSAFYRKYPDHVFH